MYRSLGAELSTGQGPFEEGKTAKIGIPKKFFASHDGGLHFWKVCPSLWTVVAVFLSEPASLKRTDSASVTLSLRDPWRTSLEAATVPALWTDRRKY